MTELNHTPESAPPPSGHLVKAHYYVGGLGLCLSILLVILRLSHRHSSRRLGWDDVFLFLSLAFSAAMQILMIYAVWLGTMCYHQDDIPPDQFNIYNKLSYVAAPMFVLSIGCAKMSTLFVLRDIASVYEAYKTAFYFLIVAMAAITLAITAGLFIARPATSSVGAIALFLAAASSHIVTDMVLVVLTILRVSRVQLPLKKKLFATGIFSLGLITAGISTAHLILLTQLLGSSDLTWDAAPASITSLFEVNLYVIFACTPEVRNVLRDIASQWTVPADPSHAEDHPSSYTIPSQPRLRDEESDLERVEPCNASAAGTDSSWNGSTRELL